MSWQEEGVPRAPRPAEEGVPRAPRPAVAVPPTPANYVPQSLRPSQSAGALVASGEDESQVRILPGLRVRIRIQSGRWIRIRIQEGKNDPQK
jgi:hypothetical protein